MWTPKCRYISLLVLTSQCYQIFTYTKADIITSLLSTTFLYLFVLTNLITNKPLSQVYFTHIHPLPVSKDIQHRLINILLNFINFQNSKSLNLSMSMKIIQQFLYPWQLQNLNPSGLSEFFFEIEVSGTCILICSSVSFKNAHLLNLLSIFSLEHEADVKRAMLFSKVFFCIPSQS